MSFAGSTQHPTRTDQADDGRAARNRYLEDQGEAIRRVYAQIYPNHRLHIVLKALDHPQGTPDAIKVMPGRPVPGMIDDKYLGTLKFSPAMPLRGSDPNAVAVVDGQDITVVAPVPRQITPGDMQSDKTAPDFQHHPVLGRMLWHAPVLFEQGKYFYEARQQARIIGHHSFDPVPRATSLPLGQISAPGGCIPGEGGKSPAILIGVHWLETGGAERLAMECVAWARAAGFRVLIVAELPGPHRNAWKLPDDPDIEFIRADAYLPPDRWGTFLQGLVQSENIRALHIHHNTRLYDNLMQLKALFPDLAVIDSTHIIEHSNGGFPRTSGVWTRYIDHHHVISRDLVSFYLDRFGVSEKVLLGRMLDPVPADDSPPDPEFRLKAGQKSCRIAFVGRMVHQKRAPLVVEITRKLKAWAGAQGVALHVDMVGTGAYLDVVRTMIRKARLSDTIALHPPDTDVPALLEQADILILPSSNEGLALVCYEAIRHGVLPISTDVGGQAELIPDSLLVARAPRACIRETVDLIGQLMIRSDLLEDCKQAVLDKYRSLGADPTAQETLGTLYRDILKGQSTS